MLPGMIGAFILLAAGGALFAAWRDAGDIVIGHDRPFKGRVYVTASGEVFNQ